MGPNSGGYHFVGTPGAAAGDIRAGMVPVGGAYRKDGTLAGKYLQSYGSAFWGGATGAAAVWDPFCIAFDVNYGAITWGEDGRLNRSGWLASLLFEYKLDWTAPVSTAGIPQAMTATQATVPSVCPRSQPFTPTTAFPPLPSTVSPGFLKAGATT
ncbi:hypothetical protein AGMMS49974_06050 [Deltaproteobacteria bacterium]|nr:hypothetical protein AGMMS49974_06050 [Deltaproteobacteria bacterium]